MNKKLRERISFSLLRLKGYNSGQYFYQYLEETQAPISSATTSALLTSLLSHAGKFVPYYRDLINHHGDGYLKDPLDYLAKLPVLTKKTIRTQFEQLKSEDLSRRKWYFNTTGGSTGEPVNFIQDVEFGNRADAIKQLFSTLIGYQIGERQVYFWGNIHDIKGGTESWQAKIMNRVNNRHFISIFDLAPEKIHGFFQYLNRYKPQLIISYVWVLNEMARFAEREGLFVEKQQSIISTAGTLFPPIRKVVEEVFQCRVYNRYGSREVGDVACERPGYEGLWVAPWGNYIEIVDEEGNRLPDGVEGRILITSLNNTAMPLIRYDIGDVGSLVPARDREDCCQVLKSLTGRTIDLFVNRKGKTVEAAHFMPLLYNKDWVGRYQVIQKSPSEVLFKIIPNSQPPTATELEEIKWIGRRIMDDPESEIEFEFVDHIPQDASGKFRYIKSEYKK